MPTKRFIVYERPAACGGGWGIWDRGKNAPVVDPFTKLDTRGECDAHCFKLNQQVKARTGF